MAGPPRETGRALSGRHRPLRRSTAALVAGLTAGPAAYAQQEPPLGEWAGPGTYCVRGVALVVPDGVEIISFGAGVEPRTVDGVDLGELLAPTLRGVPSLAELATQIQAAMDCAEPAAIAVTGPQPVADAPVATERMVVACRGAEATFGIALARAPIDVDGEPAAALLTLHFGDTAFTVGRLAVGAALPEDRLMPLFDGMAASLAPCVATE
ncbi:MAG: hypothetical protein R3F55_09795 [Alphaproteobacteria bacterium]